MISFLPLYLQFKGLSGTEIGWVLAIGPFASIISQPFWGYVSDKYKTVKRILIFLIAAMLLSSVIFFQMNELVTILIFGAILYFFSSPVGALSDSLAQRRAQQMNVSFGSIRMWGSVGFAFSSLVVGEFLTSAGIAYLMWPYVTIGAILLIISFTLTDVKTESSTPVQMSDVKKLLQNKPFILFLLFMMFITIAHRANDSFIGIYVTELGGSEGMVGLAWFVGVLSEAAVFALSRFWFRTYHPLVFVIVSSILYCMRWFLYGATTDPVLIIVFQVLHGLTFGVFYVAAFDYVTRVIPNMLQSTGHLLFYSVMFGVSGIIGSLLGGAIIDTHGGATLFTYMGGFTLIGVFCLIGYQIWIKRQSI